MDFKHILLATSAYLSVLISGCAVSEITTARNDPLPMAEPGEFDIPSVPRASMRLPLAPAGKPFVGIAISGGGSRAATFAWSVLERLNRLGILEYVDAISSVSGGSLTAAMYSLHADELRTDSEWSKYREMLAQDFLTPWIRRLMYPSNLYKMATSDYERTHVMAKLFDERLFHQATFKSLGDIGPRKPKLLINATAAGAWDAGAGFVFDDLMFASIGSRLDSYPIADAVMASGAFPGAFGNITLKTFNNTITTDNRPIPSFVRLYDGGPADNLGIRTLLASAQLNYRQSIEDKRMTACLLIVIDSSTVDAAGQLELLTIDTDHSLLDLIVKGSAWRSINGLLNNNRVSTLREFNIDAQRSVYPPTIRQMLMTRDSGTAQTPRVTREWVRTVNPIGRFKLFSPRGSYDSDWWWDELARQTDPPQPEMSKAKIEQWLAATRAAKKDAPMCLIWHISFERLRAIESYVDGAGKPFAARTRAPHDDDSVGPATGAGEHQPEDEFVDVNWTRLSTWAIASSIETSYKLTGPSKCSSDLLLKILDGAAQILTLEDRNPLDQVCKWFEQAGLNVRCGKPPKSLKPRDLPEGVAALVFSTKLSGMIPAATCDLALLDKLEGLEKQSRAPP